MLLIVNMCQSPVALDNCKKETVALQLNLHFLNNVVNLSDHNNMLCYRVWLMPYSHDKFAK